MTKVIDTRSRRVRGTYAAEAKARKEQLKNFFSRLQLDAIDIRTDQGYIDPLVHFFKERHARR